MSMQFRALAGSLRHQGLVATYYQRKWHRLPRNEGMLIDPVLPENSVIVDAGGFVGEYAADMLVQLPSCRILIFEPQIEFVTMLRARFIGNPNVAVIAAALWDRDEYVNLVGEGDSTRISTPNPPQGPRSRVHAARALDVASVVASQQSVDMLKLNVEGAEYAILERLIWTQQLGKVHRLLIQFHRVPGAGRRRREITRALARTHTRVWCFPWVWEYWECTK